MPTSTQPVVLSRTLTWRSAALVSLRAMRADAILFAGMLVFVAGAAAVGWSMLSPVGL